jgi:hypothetical protein
LCCAIDPTNFDYWGYNYLLFVCLWTVACILFFRFARFCSSWLPRFCLFLDLFNLPLLLCLCSDSIWLSLLKPTHFSDSTRLPLVRIGGSFSYPTPTNPHRLVSTQSLSYLQVDPLSLLVLAVVKKWLRLLVY